MKQQNQRISLTKRGGDTYTVNIIKKDKNTEKKLEFGLFGFQLCSTLTYSKKFNSGDVVTEKKPFWAPLYSLLINIYNRKNWKNINFQKLVFELPVPLALGGCASK